MHPIPGSAGTLLRAWTFLIATVVAPAAELSDLGRSLEPAQIAARRVTIAVADVALGIEGTGPASERSVIFPLPEKWRDLSHFRIPPSLRARSGSTGDLRWRDGALAAAAIVSSHGNPCSVRARTPLQLGKVRSHAEGSDDLREFTTVARKSYEV